VKILNIEEGGTYLKTPMINTANYRTMSSTKVRMPIVSQWAQYEIKFSTLTKDFRKHMP